MNNLNLIQRYDFGKLLLINVGEGENARKKIWNKI
jgi:hypothetical protein